MFETRLINHLYIQYEMSHIQYVVVFMYLGNNIQ